MAKIADYKSTNLSKQKVSRENEVLRTIRFIVPSQNATISPPIGPILGQFGISIMEFCKQFNDRSKYLEPDVLVIVELLLYKNKTFSFSIKTPPLSFLVNEENYTLTEEFVPSYIDLSALFKILQVKRYGYFQNEVSLFRSLCGTLRSMHVQVCFDL